jgi:hypothetical protein
MSFKAAAQVRHHEMVEFTEKVQRVHGLVEQYAMARVNADEHLPRLGRAFSQLKTAFLRAGQDNLSQMCAAMEIATRRGLSRAMKVRILRDTVGSIRMQLDVAVRRLLADVKAEEEKEKEEREKREN